MAIVGKVVALTGTAYIITDNGDKRQLQLGDTVETSDTIQTVAGAEVELDMTSGRVMRIGPEQLVAFTPELTNALGVDALDSELNLATIETVIKAIESGKDINAVLEETAAGSGSRVERGFDFVNLLRIVDPLNQFGFNYDFDYRANIDDQPILGRLIDDETNRLGGEGVTGNSPIAVTDNYTMAEDGAAITLTPLTGDSDPDGTTPTIQSINGTALTPGVAQAIAVTGGTVNITAGGVITFTPALNFNGTVNFPYVITDGTTTATANQVITVTPVNDAPIAVTDNYTMAEDGAAITLTPLTGDSDPDGTTPTIQSINGTALTPGVAQAIAVTGGTVNITAGGVITFTPALNFNGTVNFPYVITDGTTTATANQVITVTPVNDAPVDGNETNTVIEDTTLTVADGAAGDLLNNATDVDGNPLTITGYTIAGIAGTQAVGVGVLIPSVGTITINANGSYSFVPVANYTGAIPVITYTVSDGTLTDTSTLTLSITPVNDAPIAVTDNYTMAEDGAAITLTPLTGDSDPDGTTPTIQSINGTALTPGVAQAIAVTGGTVNITAGGVITFTPALNFNGTVNFPYVITDGTTTATANQVITVTPVNDAPVDGNETNTVTQNVTLTVPVGPNSLLANATDVDGDPLTITSFIVAGNPVPFTVTAGSPGVANIANVGVLAINANGSYSFAPAANYVGLIPVVTYAVSDGAGGTVTSTLTLTIGANIPPVDGDETNTVTEDVTLIVPVGPDSLLANATDADGNSLTVTSFLVAGNPTPFTVTAGSPGVANIAGVGILTINANGSYSFAPAANYTGAIPVVTYTVSDGAGGTDTSTLTLIISPVNDAPVATPASITPTEDTPISVPLAGTDVDGTIASFTITSGPTPAQGTLVYDADGNPATPPVAVPLNTALTPAQAATVQFVPTLNYNGPVAPVTFTVTDNGGLVSPVATVTINPVTPVNDAPIAVTDNYTMAEDGAAITLTPLTGDSDPDGTTPTIQSINGTALTPGVAQAIAVTGGTVNITAGGVITFTPALNFNGTVNFPYVITDGTTTATANQVITVTPVNDAPVDGNETNTVIEDTTLTVADGAAGDLLNNATDVDGNPLTITGYTIAGIAGTQAVGVGVLIPSVGTITINANGSYSFVPVANYTGATPVITYTVSDGTLTDTSTLTLSITPVNDAPIAVTDNYTMAEDGAAITLTPLTGDSDPDGTTPTIQSINGTALTPGVAQAIAVTGGTVNITAGGVITFTPALNFNGTVNFPYVITDGTTTATANQVITVTPVNDAPVDGNETNTVIEDTTLTVADGAAGDLLNNATDVDGNPLTITGYTIAGIAGTQAVGVGVLIPSVGTITINANGSYSFVPVANYTGAIPVITYTVSDGTLTDTSTLTLSITPVNDAPIAVTDNYTMAEDGAAITLTPLTGDSDPDGTTPTIQSINGTALTPGVAQAIAVTGGTVNITAGGVITFTPALNFNGTVNFPYVITDGTTTATANQVITVTPVNDAPIAVTDNYTMAEDGAAITLTPLTGDSDPDGTTPTIQSINGTALTPGVAQAIAVTGGTVNITAGGVITFTPALNFNGTVNFPYVITDGTTTATANQVITVTPVNDAPVDGNETNTVIEDTTLTVADGAAGDLLNNATDVDGNPLTITGYTIAGIAGTQAVGVGVLIPSVGTITINANGSYSFVPVANYTGAIPVITYTVSDGTLTDTSTLTLSITPVNDAPIAVTDNYTMAEDGAAITLTPLTGDSDPDGTTPTIQSINGTALTPGVAQAIAVTGGTVNITAGGVITFTPALNFNGTVNFPYVITDGTTTATANQVITVTPVNDAPIAVTDNYTMAEDGAAITLTPLTGDSDPDGTTPTIQSINGTALTPGVAQAIAVTGGTVNITAGGVITFTPALNFNGTVNFPYVITDGTTTATANQVITVTPVNDAPVDGNETNTVIEDTTLTVADGAAGDLLNNATDVDGNPLTITGYTIAGIAGTQAVGVGVLIPSVGTITINANGSYSFVPVANYTGAIPVITYTVSDGTLTDTSTLTLSITPVNDAPIAVTDNYTMAEDGAAITLTPLTGDSDPDGTTPTIQSINGTALTPGVAQAIAVTGGTVNITAGGVITFTPALNFNGTVNFPYVITDGTTTATANQVITVTPVNDAPVDGNETNTVIEDTTLTVADGAAGDLLNNATDVDGNPLTITGYTIAGIAGTQAVGVGVLIPSVGTITINANGSYSFVPVANYTGAIPVITYTVSDGTLTDTSTLTLSITPVNDAPIAVTDNYTMAEDGAAITLTPLTGDSDPDGTTPTIQSINGTALTPGVAQAIAVTGGTVNITAGGVITFTPALNFNGTVNFPYVITDGTTTATANQVITVTPVNDAPIAVTDNYTMAEDGAAITLTPLTGDSDPDGTTPTIQSINGTALTPGVAQAIAVTGGTVNITAGGVITFTPALNFNGTVNFPYVITDGTTTATANQVITVTPVNDAPVDGNETNTVIEDTTLTVADGAAGDLLNNATDVDGNPLTITGYTIAGIAGTQAVGVGVLIPSVGTITINANGSYSFVPVANYTGAIPVITYTVSDGTLTDTSTLTLSITPVNDAPIAVTDNYTMAEDGAAITLTPLTGDSDPDGTTPTIQSINGTALTPGVAQAIAVTGGTVNITAGGVITFTPALNFNGTVNFPYVITDGTTTATANQVITVTPVNDAPIAVTDNYTMAEDGAAITLTPLTGDSDPDGTTPTIQSINGTALTPGVAQAIAVTGGTVNITAGGVITFTPALNFNGTVNFPYVITDGTTTATANQVITVTPVNDAPVDGNETNTVIEDTTLTVADGAAGDLLNNATDVDGNPLTITGYTIAGIAGTQAVGVGVLIPSVGTITINANGSYSFVPVANYTGAIPVITYTVSDGTLTDTSTLTLSITPVNDAPIAVTDNYTMAEDGAAITLTPLTGDSDPDGTTPTIQSINGTALTPGVAQAIAVTGGTVNITAGGVITFTPALNFNGTVNFPYVITDGTTTATANQVITVTPVNDAPIAVTDNYTMAEDGAAITLTPLTGDSDPDGTTPTIQSINGTALTPGVAQAIAVTGGTVNITAGGVITFTPALNFNGTVNFPYVITDGTTTATANQVITVTPVNDAPVDGNETNTVIEDTTLTVADGAAGDLLNNATDVDGNPLTITGYTIAGIAGTQAVGVGVLIPSVGTITINANGSYSFVPVANYTGAIPVITYTVSDGTLTDTSTLTLSITPVNDAPIAVTDNYTMAEDGAAITLTPLTGDSDPDGTTPTIQSINGTALTPGVAQAIAVTGGTVNITAGGVITFTPALNFNGTVNFPYVITDGTTTATANQVITVTPVNDAPIAVTDNYTMAEDGAAITLTPLTGDSDPDGTTPTIQSINGTALTPGVAQAIAVTGGTVNITAGGVITFTPALNFNGTVNFPYVITDGTTTATANQVITVTPVNDAPVDGNETNTVIEDTTLTVADGAAGDLLNNATDVDGNPLTITGYTIAGIAGTQAVGVGVLIPSVGTITINANGSYSFVPVANYTGAIPVITYTVSDGTLTDTSTLTLSITPVNDAPIAVTDNYTMAEDGAAITLTPLTGDSDPDGTTPTIQSINGTALTPGVAQAIAVTGGTVNITAGGVITFTPALNFNGTVNFPYVITDGTTTATANQVITVTPVNDAPIAVTDNYTMAEDGAAITLTPLTGDSDPDGTTPTIQSINGTALTPGVAQAIAVTGGTVNITAGGVITFTPALNFNGTVNFPYVITDGTTTATANQVITVTPVNDAPVDGNETNTVIEDTTLTVADGAAGDLLNNATDVDGNPLTITGYTIAGIAGTQAVGVGVLIPSVGTITINANGSYSFVPVANYTGAIPVITYTVSDGTLTDTSTLTLSITPVNDAPIAVTDNYTMAEDGAAITLTPLTGDSDPDGTTPTIQSINGTALTPGVAQAIAVTGGTVNITAGGVITFTPALNFNGTVNFPYVITDGTTTATANQVITVTPVNDAPVNTVPISQTTPEDTPRVFSTANGNVISVTDPDGAGVPLTTTVTVTNGTFNAITGGGATISNNGTATVTISGSAAQINAALQGASYSNTPDFNGTATVTVATSDGTVTDTDVINMTITPVSDTVNDTLTINKNTPITFNPITGTNGASADNFEGLTPQIIQIDGNNITVGGPAVAITNGSVTLATGNVLTFTPAPGFTGTVPPFTYTVSSGGVTEIGTVNVNVRPEISINDVTIAENLAAGFATFTVTLSAASAQTITVNYSTANGTAVSGVGNDYTAVTNTLTFTPGQTTQTITVPINNDTTDEPNETFFVNLSGVTNAVIIDSQGVGTIIDNDATPTISNVSSDTEMEGTALVHTVTLSNPSSSDTTFSVSLGGGTATGGGVDYVSTLSNASFSNGVTISGGIITVPAGVTSFTVTVASVNDIIDEVGVGETYNLTVGGVTGVGTINDNDAAPTLTVNNISVTEVDNLNAVFTLSLSRPSSNPVTVNLSFANGSATGGNVANPGNTSAQDYGDNTRMQVSTDGGTTWSSFGTNTATFAAGQTSILVRTLINENNPTNEPDETFTLTATVSAGTTQNSNALGTATITERNLTLTSTETESETAANLSFTYTLPTATAATNYTFSVSGTATGGDVDYGTPVFVVTGGTGTVILSGGILIVGPNVTGFRIDFPHINDTLDEFDETVIVDIGGVIGTGTITDNDPTPSLSINNQTVNEAAGTMTFTVTLSAASGLPVTVNYNMSSQTALSGSDFTSTSGTLTFAPGVTTQTITVPILNDNLYEGTETFRVDLSLPTNATILSGTGIGTIRDDGAGTGGTDNDTPTLAVSSITVSDQTAGFATFVVSLSNPSSVATTFNLALANGTATGGGIDYGSGTATNLQVSNDNGATWINAISATIPILGSYVLVRTPIIADVAFEVSETFTLTATRTAGITTNTSAIGIATITDIFNGPDAINDLPISNLQEDSVNSVLAGNVILGGGGNVADTDPNNDTLLITGAIAGAGAVVGTVPLGSALTVSGIYGNLLINADGSFTYTLDNSRIQTQNILGGQTVNDVFTYRITDGNGGFDTATISIPILGTLDLTAITPQPIPIIADGLIGEYYGYNDTIQAANSGFRIHADDALAITVPYNNPADTGINDQRNINSIEDLEFVINGRNALMGGSNNIVGTNTAALVDTADVKFSVRSLNYGESLNLPNSAANVAQSAGATLGSGSVLS
jgi:VCBS repeat-containing protein